MGWKAWEAKGVGTAKDILLETGRVGNEEAY